MKKRSRAASNSQPPALFILSGKRSEPSTATATSCSAPDHLQLSKQSMWHGRRHARLSFSSITLSSLLERLPKLTERSATFDPWAADCTDAPKGVVPVNRRSYSSKSRKESEIDVRKRLAAAAAAGGVDELHAGSQANDRSRENLNGAADAQNSVSRSQPAQADDLHSERAEATAQTDIAQQAEKGTLPRPEGDAPLRQNQQLAADNGEERQEGKHPANFGEWLSQLLPKLPASPAQLRNSLPLWLVLSPPGKPDKRRLMTVHDFFKHAEDESRAFFRELDSDGDGKVTAYDVRRALRERNLPDGRARDLISAARSGRWWSQSIEWEEFRSLVEEREPGILRAYTAMPVDAQGQLKSSAIQDTLTKLGVAATEENAKAMVRALGGNEDGTVTYDRFRRFALLLPEEQIAVMDPGRAWFEAASMMPLGRPADIPEQQRSQDPNYLMVLAKAALAGGLASSVSVLTLHPVDTLKTRLQTTAGATLGTMARSAPAIGIRGLYRGIIPAVGGSFVSHGVRTLSYEATAAGLGRVLGSAAEMQIQGLASGVGTVFGTCIRIPCEVMKQRLQVGRHDNAIEAARAATVTEGMSGLFRGTTALLAREVPFYVLGMIGYQQLKKVANGSTWGGRPKELANWQYIAIGGMAGAMASVATMPMDVLKTRIMTAAAGSATPAIGALLVSIVKQEGIGALYKGALPRALWVAPVGAMNFAGYELAKRALSGPEAAQPERKPLAS